MLIDVPDLDISVECDRCKASLDAEWNEQNQTIKVTPCPDCIDSEREDARNHPD
jgi:hypothetical protein